MERQVMVRRLTEADLSLFDRAGRDPFSWQDAWMGVSGRVIDASFPALARRRWRIPLEVVVEGPGDAETLSVSRRLERDPRTGRWRLGGEWIGRGTDRFARVTAGDVVLMAFEGDGAPTVVRLFVLAAALPADAPLVRAFAALVPEGAASGTGTRARVAEISADAEEGSPVWMWGGGA